MGERYVNTRCDVTLNAAVPPRRAGGLLVSGWGRGPIIAGRISLQMAGPVPPLGESTLSTVYCCLYVRFTNNREIRCTESLQ